MKLENVVVHDCNPGTEPSYVLDQLRTVGLTGDRVGLEFDATQKHRVGAATSPGESMQRRYQPVAISRDNTNRVPFEEHIQAFVRAGFAGPFAIDFINRRAVQPILQVLTQDSHSDLLSRTLLQVPEMALMYKTPMGHFSGQYRVEEEWQKVWSRICINSRFPDLVREFLVHDQQVNLFWEPLDSYAYRAALAEIIKDRRIGTIVYKIPHLTYSAKFDPDECLARDLDFFNSVSHEMTVVPLGSVDQLKTHAPKLFRDASENGTTNFKFPASWEHTKNGDTTAAPNIAPPKILIK